MPTHSKIPDYKFFDFYSNTLEIETPRDNRNPGRIKLWLEDAIGGGTNVDLYMLHCAEYDSRKLKYNKYMLFFIVLKIFCINFCQTAEPRIYLPSTWYHDLCRIVSYKLIPKWKHYCLEWGVSDWMERDTILLYNQEMKMVSFTVIAMILMLACCFNKGVLGI